MKKETNQPIDDLFARKLGNASLSPTPNGFERLQARMGQRGPETHVVFWRNPAVMRYMAAAACLLLVCLFGWLYMQSNSDAVTGETQVATQLNQPKKPVQEMNEQGAERNTATGKPGNQERPVNTENQLAIVDRQLMNPGDKTRLPNAQTHVSHGQTKPAGITTIASPAVAQVTAHDNRKEPIGTPALEETSIEPVNTEQLAESKSKPSAPAERVLTVTIEEPESIVTARQAAGRAAEKGAASVVNNDKQFDQETKGGNLWQQVRRIKQGDIFARHDNPTNEDRGLLGRAYSGLKQSFEKDKPEKQ